MVYWRTMPARAPPDPHGMEQLRPRGPSQAQLLHSPGPAPTVALARLAPTPTPGCPSPAAARAFLGWRSRQGLEPPFGVFGKLHLTSAFSAAKDSDRMAVIPAGAAFSKNTAACGDAGLSCWGLPPLGRAGAGLLGSFASSRTPEDRLWPTLGHPQKLPRGTPHPACHVPASTHRSACWSACHNWALQCGCSGTGSGQ